MNDTHETDPVKDPANLPPDVAAIIGIGVSAKSLGSFLEILTSTEPGLGGAYLVAIGGKDRPSEEDLLSEATAVSSLKVMMAEDGAPLLPEHVYIAGADRLLTLDAGRLSVRDQPAGEKAGAVDTMLDSIARAAGRHSVAVILNGLHAEGAVGLRAAKEFGGLTIGEWDPGDADGSEKAGPSGVLDIRGTPSRIAAEIDLYIGNIAVLPEESIRITTEEVETEIAGIVSALRKVTGNDFHGYKRGTFVRRVQRRLQVLQMPDIAAYVELLRENREEVQRLFQDLLIGVTQFFRDPQEFDLLEREIPSLFEGKRAGDMVRVWVLGCATGEEAYSIAMLLKEYASTLEEPPRIQIFATDLDARALGLARAARYAPTIAGHIRPDRLERWFTREGDTYSVVKELREICIFSPHNLVRDAPFSRIDLLSCRNLLIYLNIEVQDRTIPLFHFALRGSGLLMLGSSENVTRHQTLFAPVDRKNRLFRRLDTATRVIPDFPPSLRAQSGSSVTTASPDPLAVQLPRLSDSIGRQADAVAERFAPGYVVIDTQFEVLHFSGRIGRFLEPLAGAASLSLLSLVHPDLRGELRAALYRALTEAKKVELLRQVIKHEEQASCVNIIIEPLSREHITSLVVVFQHVGPASGEIERSAPAGADDHVQRIESELRLTRERLQATIEELESTNEELRSSNEEYQSINEELQSTNEELETSKEELQSLNEELQTVNMELGHQIHELARSNSDIKNLLEASQIATIFLDNDFRLRTFTASATEVFHLLETDVGRPLDHVVARISYPEIHEDVRQVLQSLIPIDRMVSDRTRDRHYAVRVLPYRSIENFIGGTVLTFTDMTATHHAERALQDSEKRLHVLIDGLPQLIWRADPGGSWTWASPQWATYTGQSVEKAQGAGWLEQVHPDDRETAQKAWAVAETAGFEADFRLMDVSTGQWRWFQTRATPVRNAEGRIIEWLGASTDMDELLGLQERQRVLVGELQHRTRNLLSVVRQVAQRTLQSARDMTDFGQRFRDRLEMLARVQGLLSGLDENSRLSFDALVRTALSAVGTDPGERLILDGPSDVPLGPSTVQLLAMALHELATNAVKHGALKGATGHLHIGWRIEGEDRRRLHITWRETGVVMPEAEPGWGQGRELIERALPYQLDAATSFHVESDGVFCTVSLPI